MCGSALAASSISPQFRQGNTGAGIFAAIICAIDGLLLLGVAMMQMASGGLGILIGLWNLGVTGVYMAVAGGLAARRDWSYQWGLRLALSNIGFLIMQAAFWGTVAASEAAMYPLCILLIGDIILAGVLLSVKNAMLPPPKPQEIVTPPTLVAELERAVQVPLPSSAQSVPVSTQAGAITPQERDLLVAVRSAFIADQSKRKLVQVKTDLEIEGEHVDLIVRDWSSAVFTLGRAPVLSHVYLFRPVVDADLVEWMKRTIWKKEREPVAIITVAASQRALETGSGGWFPPGQVGVYTLRDGAKCTTRHARSVVSLFEKWFKKWRKQQG